MAFKKIAIAGATGYLGRKVLSHILTISTITQVTVLTRSISQHDFPTSDILSVKTITSYEDERILTSILQGHDILISTVAGAAVEKIDPLLISAAISAGVRRFMPSEYTLDVMHPHAIAVAGSTVLGGRIRAARQVEAIAETGALEYTTLVSGGTLDWWFENGNLGLDMKRKKATLYDGGEKEVTGSTTDFIAQCVGAIVKMDTKQTKNKRIRIAEQLYSGKKLLKAFEEVTDQKWEVEEKTTDSLLDEGKEANARDDWRGFYLGNILKLNFDGKGAAYFKEGLDFGDGLVHRRSLADIVKTAVLAQSD